MFTKIPRNLSQEERAFAMLLANYDGCKRVFPPGATLTLTQSGLLAVLLERRRHKAIRLPQRCARQEKMRTAFGRALASLLHSRKALRLADERAKSVIRTAPRHI